MADNLSLVFVPALVVVLREAERQLGRELSEREVFAVRDNSPVIALAPDEADRVLAARGYDDIDSARCWQEWAALRDQT